MVRMNPEIVKWSAENPELFPVQGEPVSIVGCQSGHDVAAVREVLVDGLQGRLLRHLVAGDDEVDRIENL